MITDCNISLIHLILRANSIKIYKAGRTLCLFGEEMSEITIVLSTSSLNQMRFKLILEEVTDFSTTHPMEHKKIIKNVQIGSPHFHYVDLSGTKGK